MSCINYNFNGKDSVLHGLPIVISLSTTNDAMLVTVRVDNKIYLTFWKKGSKIADVASNIVALVTYTKLYCKTTLSTIILCLKVSNRNHSLADCYTLFQNPFHIAPFNTLLVSSACLTLCFELNPR